jgi:phosphoserine phosphatase
MTVNSPAASFGLPSFKEGKVRRLMSGWQFTRYKAGRMSRDSWFYSDSLNDLPLLEIVHHPVAVDPDATLKACAEQRGWPVLSLRKPTRRAWWSDSKLWRGTGYGLV